MKTMLCCLLALAILGCHSAVATTEVKAPAPPQCYQVKDNFDQVGMETASGMRYVWNKSKQTYEWVSSDENKDRFNHAWEYSKEKSQQGYNYLQEKLNK